MSGGLTSKDSKGVAIITSTIVTWCLALIGVMLRIWGRRLGKNKLWWDDWLAVASLVPSTVMTFFTACYMVPNGFGKHILNVPPHALYSLSLGLFVDEITLVFGLALVKLSILALCWRVFNVDKMMRIGVWIMVAIVICWLIAGIVPTCLQCLPVSASWQRFSLTNPLKAKDYKCNINIRTFAIGHGIPNMITDLLILILPLPGIWRLNLRTPQKLALSAVFLLGLFITIVSIIRLVYMIQTDVKAIDVTWLTADGTTWACIELNVAILTACLPPLKPVFGVFARAKSLFSQQSSLNSSSRAGRPRSTVHHQRLDGNSQQDLNLELGSKSYVLETQIPAGAL